MNYTVVLLDFGLTASMVKELREINAFLEQSSFNRNHGKTIVFYQNETNHTELLNEAPTDHIIFIKVSSYQPEMFLSILHDQAAVFPSNLYVFSDDPTGSMLAVRLAKRLKGKSLTGVTAISCETQHFLCTKMVYSNHVEASFRLSQSVFCIALAKGAVTPVVLERKVVPNITFVDKTCDSSSCSTEKVILTAHSGSQSLDDASFVLVAGQGAGSSPR